MRYKVRHSLTHGYYVFDRERGAAVATFPRQLRSGHDQYVAAKRWVAERTS